MALPPSALVEIGTPKMATKCYLLDLPPELRTIIYQYVLVQNTLINTSTQATTQQRAGFWHTIILQMPKLPALFRTSRQLRAEAAPVYYGMNTFKIFAVERDCISAGCSAVSITPDSKVSTRPIVVVPLLRRFQIWNGEFLAAVDLSAGNECVSVRCHWRDSICGGMVDRAKYWCHRLPPKAYVRQAEDIIAQARARNSGGGGLEVKDFKEILRLLH